MDKGATDDTRKIATPDSSMMGRPDLQPQPMKVRTRKTRPERNRKDEIWDNLILRITSSWVSWMVNITIQTFSFSSKKLPLPIVKYKFTNFIIRGPLAGLHRSPLTYCLLSGLNLATTNVWYSPTYWFSKESSLVILGLRKVNIWSQEISWNLQPFLFFFFFSFFFVLVFDENLQPFQITRPHRQI